VVAGRGFNQRDAGRKVAMINESMAKRHFPGRQPVGRSIQCGRESYEIIGVARDAHVSSLERLDAALYLPFSGNTQAHILIRTDTPGARERLTACVGRIEPRATVEVRSLVENLEMDLRPSRMASMVAGAMGALALTLSSIGMFGVFAYAVRQRTREIGMRMALGAGQGQVIRDVLCSSSRAVAGGLAAGLLGSVLASWLIESGLHGVTRLDPATYGVVLALVTVAALAASLWPARMISKIDPVVALRCE
jgi:predicted lysophospholipase L1 biosynthesis ABC-type transport system permease subunit